MTFCVFQGVHYWTAVVAKKRRETCTRTITEISTLCADCLATYHSGKVGLGSECLRHMAMPSHSNVMAAQQQIRIDCRGGVEDWNNSNFNGLFVLCETSCARKNCTTIDLAARFGGYAFSRHDQAVTQGGCTNSRFIEEPPRLCMIDR